MGFFSPLALESPAIATALTSLVKNWSIWTPIYPYLQQQIGSSRDLCMVLNGCIVWKAITTRPELLMTSSSVASAKPAKAPSLPVPPGPFLPADCHVVWQWYLNKLAIAHCGALKLKEPPTAHGYEVG